MSKRYLRQNLASQHQHQATTQSGPMNLLGTHVSKTNASAEYFSHELHFGNRMANRHRFWAWPDTKGNIGRNYFADANVQTTIEQPSMVNQTIFSIFGRQSQTMTHKLYYECGVCDLILAKFVEKNLNSPQEMCVTLCKCLQMWYSKWKKKMFVRWSRVTRKRGENHGYFLSAPSLYSRLYRSTCCPSHAPHCE